MPEVISKWRTDDMSLAAFLALQGHELKGLEWELDSCYFCFDETDELIDASVDFMSGQALVEPRLYNMTFAKLKRKMFADPQAPTRRR